MRFSDLLLETWAALTANKGRSLLTMLGIIIGIAAVIGMTSLIGGVKSALVSELGLDQSRTVYINYQVGQPATSAQAEQIMASIDGYEFISSMQSGSARASTSVKQSDVSVLGVNRGFFRAESVKLVQGRLLTDEELSGSAAVTVIDKKLADTLFGEGANATEQGISIGDATYAVRGVVESSSMLGGQGSVYVPYLNCTLRVTGRDEVDQFVGFAREGVSVEGLVQRTKSYLQERFNVTDADAERGLGRVNVQSVSSIQQQLDSTLVAFQMMMTAVAGISLLVGGIGIMNMMLTNVTERIREIGLRKALGAHSSDITRQFLLESVAPCLAGGAIGFALGLGAAQVLSGVASSALGANASGGAAVSVTPAVSWDTALLAVGICVGIGVLFGYGPARRAAKLDPVESLRYQ